MEARKGRLRNDEISNKVIDTGFAVVEEAELENNEIGQKPEITDDDIVAQVMIFFFAGFDTASTLMSHLVYELALNVEVQEKLQAEIDEVADSCKNDVSYEALLGMKYLDMVVSGMF